MKVVKIKTLESRVWKLCKKIIRAKYSHICVCCNTPVEGKQLHTGHYFRKKFLPMQMRYDIRLLRPQCSTCNRRKHGALEYYTVHLLQNYPNNYILDIYKDILHYKSESMNTSQTREFLLALEQEYATILSVLTRG